MKEENKDQEVQLAKQDVPVSDTADLTESDLENVSGGFLDAHGDVCIGLGAMATITTGGTKN